MNGLFVGSNLIHAKYPQTKVVLDTEFSRTGFGSFRFSSQFPYLGKRVSVRFWCSGRGNQFDTHQLRARSLLDVSLWPRQNRSASAASPERLCLFFGRMAFVFRHGVSTLNARTASEIDAAAANGGQNFMFTSFRPREAAAPIFPPHGCVFGRSAVSASSRGRSSCPCGRRA
jgi:hypothetical protein